MDAIAQSRYGGPETLERREVARPTPAADEVLVDVRAASVNPGDWHFMRGEPYLIRLFSGLRRPSQPVRGLDVAGRVAAVGADVTGVQPGDAVFGEGDGTFAEFAIADGETVAPMPPSLAFEDAAAVPVAGVTALQGLRDEGGVEPGDRVLINGASGGVGTFAVQIAADLGADVTGVCSSRNLELVRSLGASHVVDYTETDFTRAERSYDVVFDLVGNRSLSALRRVLADDGTLVRASGDGGRWLGPVRPLLRVLVVSPFVGHRLRSLLARTTREDLTALADLLVDGAVEPVIDRTYELAETPAAVEYLETRRASGKVVVTVEAEE